MADDDGNLSNNSSLHRPQETFHRAQEAQVEHKFPNSNGIFPLPRGSRGPKSLYIKRSHDSFGFTLRHFILYPPDSLLERDERHAEIGALSKPVDTIFVRHVKDYSPAQLAGLQCGDRLVGVNGIQVTEKSYADVVKLIQHSPDYLHLLVVPKEDDILQRIFSETAHNPASNQHPPEPLTDRHGAQQFLQRQLPREIRADALAWRALHPPAAATLDAEWAHAGALRPPQRLRAQPQAPYQPRDMGRRASDGCALEREPFGRAPAGCRLSLDSEQRESASSLSSRDSLASLGSRSTLTGHETDDSAINARYRKSFQQKEEFLKMPEMVQREFYSRSKKLEKPAWPPHVEARARVGNSTPSLAKGKPTQASFQRVKNEIEVERDLGVAKTPKERFLGGGLDRIREGSPVEVNGGAEDYARALQVVHARARMFEKGNPLPEDDPMSNRTNFYRSELARLSSKRVVPNVTERAHEFEVRGEKRDSPQRRIQRDSRSLDSTGSNNDSSSSLNERLNNKILSGNVIISSGSKYIHCPPPSSDKGKPTGGSENETYAMRARSNSTESWPAASPLEKKKAERMSRQDAISYNDDGIKSKDYQQMMDVVVVSYGDLPYGDLPPIIPEPVAHFVPSVAITPALVRAVRPNQLDLEGPIRPNRHLKPPTVIVDMPTGRSISPTVIGDDKPVVVKRRTKNTNIADDERTMRRESYLRATEGGRMHFEVDLSDGDISPQVLRSAHRRWRPPMFPGDIQQLRKLFEDPTSSLGGSVSGTSSSTASLDREKSNASPLEESDKVLKEGQLYCKITEIDGKRFGDRSWKQIWAILKGPMLYLVKDKHHQSPMGTADAVEHSLANGVDMRASCVRVAEDYTKRKNVLRVSGVKPCRSEFLLQADNTDELAEWVKALQEKVATTTETEAKFDPYTARQQAVPQQVPASSSVQVQGSRLSPNAATKAKPLTLAATRTRSPTGQSPVNKTRKASAAPDPTSPKTKTWRGRVAKQFRKMHGASSPSSPTAPEGSTFGVPLEHCLGSERCAGVPKLVEVCTEIIDSKGIQTVGIYRVPGNNASIMGLCEEVNRNYDSVPIEDQRWNDLHVVSSLLKLYVRRLPDSLVTNALYYDFISADKIELADERMKELRRLVKSLPPHNYHTLRHIILHLRRVSDNSAVNKMDLKNLAIVFGPNVVRADEDNMQDMVHNMNNQCKIVETFLTHPDWFFSETDNEADIPTTQCTSEETEPTNHSILLNNLSKLEALKDPKEKGPLLALIFQAANKKGRKKAKSAESREEARTPTSPISPSFPHDLKDCTDGGEDNGIIPITVTDVENHQLNRPTERDTKFKYTTDKEQFYKRIKNFEQETNEMLQKPRPCEISVNNIALKPGSLSSSASNVNTNSQPTKPNDSHLLKTHSASNVLSRTIIHNTIDNTRNSLHSTFSVQYANENNSDASEYHYGTSDANRNVQQNENKTASKFSYDLRDRNGGRQVVRRGSSVENISTMDVNANGTKKKRFESDGIGSLDSINKTDELEDGTDLVAQMTQLYDSKLKENKELPLNNLLDGNGLPFVDASPEKHARDNPPALKDKENIPDVYRNPSLHKSQQQTQLKSTKNIKLKESSNVEMEKDEDSCEKVPDNERRISNKLTLTNNNNNNNNKIIAPTLKRSESLNKTERNAAPLNNKLKRSESLNKTSGEKLKRSDSLTKNEKTENNLNRRRELAGSGNRRNNKDATKLKRKNGMPDRSIKRRHTVGGTKDPDKVTWLDNKNQEEEEEEVTNKENKDLRTSSPDLSSTRRERFLYEINAENMVRAFKQHLMGARPQSFPDTSVYKVPLESHV